MYKPITSLPRRGRPVHVRALGVAWSCLALVMLLFCGQAHAQSGRIEVGLELAPSRVKHDGDRSPAKNTYKWGISAGANLRYWLADWLAIQAGFLYATRGSDIELNDDLFNTLSFSYLQLPLLVRIGWPGDPLKWPVHVIAGSAVSYLLDASDEVGAIPRRDLSSIDVSLVAGVGGTYRFASSWSASVEARYDVGFFDAFTTQDDLQAKNRAFLLTLSIDRVLSDRDRDRDGLPDYRDECPAVSGERNGCPETVVDPDGDGIIGEKDECPDKPEDDNDYEDADGCPDGDKDEDRDGLADAKDKCPTDHFSLDPSRKYASIENEQAKQERPGCPIFRIEGIRILLDPPILFESGEDQVPPERRWILDEVARYLAVNPNIKLVVEGHADQDLGSRGKDPKGESLKRARNVIAYLVETWQILPSRLEPMGLGVTESTTAEGKNKSRRVEFRIKSGQ